MNAAISPRRRYSPPRVWMRASLSAAHVERRRVGVFDRDGDVLAFRPDPGRLAEGALDHRLKAEVEVGRVDVIALEGRLVDLEDVLERIPPPPAVAAGDRPDLLDARVAAQGLFEVGRDLLQFLEVVAVELDLRAVIGPRTHARRVILRVETRNADVDAGELGRQLDELFFQGVGPVGPFDLRREFDVGIGALRADLDVHLLLIVLGHDLLFEGPDRLVGPGDVGPRRHADPDVEGFLRVPGSTNGPS